MIVVSTVYPKHPAERSHCPADCSCFVLCNLLNYEMAECRLPSSGLHVNYGDLDLISAAIYLFPRTKATAQDHGFRALPNNPYVFRALANSYVDNDSIYTISGWLEQGWHTKVKRLCSMSAASADFLKREVVKLVRRGTLTTSSSTMRTSKNIVCSCG
jgi:hypothetical protein